jgi:cell division ATPase FtsA
MKKIPLTLFLEINNFNYIFFATETDSFENFKIIYHLEVPIEGIEKNRISDFEKTFSSIKKNIFLIEQKLNYTFKEVVLILENFNTTYINISGFKKMNGSQILRENITHILNTLKSYVEEKESKKTILHIFNSKFYLDNKKIDNLPIGLFGDFYAHELSFVLVNTNDCKNLNYMFDKCGLNIKKILVKSFIKGANILHNYKNIDTFFYTSIKSKNSKTFYF